MVRAVDENPALHMQSLKPSLPAGELEPAGQLTHVLAPEDEKVPGGQTAQDTEPSEALNVPVLHLEHSPPFEPVKPRLHVHSLAALLPGSETELAGQLIQALAATAPVSVV